MKRRKLEINKRILLSIKKETKYELIVMNCIEVFTLAKKVTSVVEEILFLPVNSLKPPTKISREIIKEDINPIYRSLVIKVIENNKNNNNTLSAIGSSISPNEDTKLYFLAKKPSKKSVIAESKNKINPNR